MSEREGSGGPPGESVAEQPIDTSETQQTDVQPSSSTGSTSSPRDEAAPDPPGDAIEADIEAAVDLDGEPGDAGDSAPADTAGDALAGDGDGARMNPKEFRRMMKEREKQQRKESMTKEEYKQWKAAQKDDGSPHKKDKKHKDKKEKKDKKDRSKGKHHRGEDSDGEHDRKRSKKEKREKEKKSKSRHTGEDGGSKRRKAEAPPPAADVEEGEGEAYGTMLGLDTSIRNDTFAHVVPRMEKSKAKPGKVPPAQLLQKRREMAEATVEKMAASRRADAVARSDGGVPINRLAVMPEVLPVALRISMQEHLVAAGFLYELTYWLCDPETRELAPLDLRTNALKLLTLYQYEGIPLPPSIAKKKERDDSIDCGWQGITTEQLAATRLGEAVNFVRKSPEEMNTNKRLATIVLETLSRVFQGQDMVEHAERKAQARPPLPQYHRVKSTTEIFHSSLTKPNPKDPLSYMKCPNRNPPKHILS